MTPAADARDNNQYEGEGKHFLLENYHRLRETSFCFLQNSQPNIVANPNTRGSPVGVVAVLHRAHAVAVDVDEVIVVPFWVVLVLLILISGNPRATQNKEGACTYEGSLITALEGAK